MAVRPFFRQIPAYLNGELNSTHFDAKYCIIAKIHAKNRFETGLFKSFLY